MQYNELIATIRTASQTFIGSLTFGSGTSEQMNADDNLSYPLCWMLPPTVQNNIAPNGTQLQGWSFTIRIVQSSSLEATRSEDDELFNETFNIAQGLVRKLYNDFQDNTTETIQVGQLSQLFRTQDSVHVGWNVPITINSFTDNNCCELFA
ncbi:hypothetical protein UFOVP1615_36 [uncultured Caudovirales phage]|uniref:Uncharacterized protein n=1 Tax=uncultured Caudovirales phage TaxID=2100421 RepID=A0A6J5SX59_9CAUD|nr:hypothetical protein UFOVP1615_36 [uncultured Caudovirales phage]